MLQMMALRCNFFRYFYLIVLLASVLPAQFVFAGALLLHNGDRIEGKLDRIDATDVYWRSESFGVVKVEKIRVKNMVLDRQVKMEGRAEPCTVEGMEGLFLNYRCGDEDRQRRISLTALKRAEPYEVYNPSTYSFSGKVKVSAEFDTGNSDEDDIDIDAEMALRRSDFRHNGTLEYEYDKKGSNDSKEMYDIVYQLDWFLLERWYWYNRLGFELDDDISLESHYSFGTGLGVQVWDLPKSALVLTAGVEYEEKRYDPDSADSSFPDWDEKTEDVYVQIAHRLRYKFISQISMFSNVESNHNVEDIEDWYVDAEWGIRWPFTESLFSEYKYELDFVHQPNGDNGQSDNKFTFGLGYKWK